MTDTQPDVLSPRDEARLELSSRAKALAEGSAALVPIGIDPEPGSLITQAMELVERAEELLAAAIVVERECGLSSEQSKKLARHRYQRRESILNWIRDGRRNRSGVPGLVLAKRLDEWARGADDAASPVSDGLDAIRFSGSAQYEAHQRGRTEGLSTALAEAWQERKEAWDALNKLTEEDIGEGEDASGIDHPVNVRVVTVSRNLASIYRSLSMVDPIFAREYLEEAESFESAADRFAKEGPF
ncbi:hypothetical protein [Streptomyces sp. NPDC093071]|uniref:hypothetical protein n=1 Tax=Streptomyces sp. NPDC093071 TaxID=3366022 RepID=UPI003811E46C